MLNDQAGALKSGGFGCVKGRSEREHFYVVHWHYTGVNSTQRPTQWVPAPGHFRG